MSELSKVTASQLRRSAIVYVRQSSLTQIERNGESTDQLLEHPGGPEGAIGHP